VEVVVEVHLDGQVIQQQQEQVELVVAEQVEKQ
jgi:hypothetical protein